MYEYNPATVPGLPAGWEINLYESGEYIVLALWRAIAYLKDFKEDREMIRSTIPMGDTLMPTSL